MVKYFPKENVDEFIRLLKFEDINYDVAALKNHFEKDPKDSFLLDLVEKSGAEYLVTGDKALLSLGSFKSAKIISPTVFEDKFKK